MTSDRWTFSRRHDESLNAWAKWKSEQPGRIFPIAGASETAFRAGFHMGVTAAQQAEEDTTNAR